MSQNARVAGAAIATLTVASLIMAFAQAAPGPQQPQSRQIPTAAQSSFNTLKVAAKFKIGKNADWVAIAPDSVLVAGTDPFTIERISPKTNSVVARIGLPGEACSGLAIGFHSAWIPLCGKTNSLARLDMRTNKLVVLPIGPAGEEGGNCSQQG